MDVRLEVVREVTDELAVAFSDLLPQLSSASPPTRDEMAEVVACPTNTVLIARLGDRPVGTLTLVMFPIPTGVRAWIEDVVVDVGTRGYGVGAALTNEAVRRARAAGARTVDLTSRPSRAAANRLYERLGFQLRDSRVYRFPLGDDD